MKMTWTEEQEEELSAFRQLADLEMVQAIDITTNCHDKFQVGKTYHYVYRRGMNKDIPRQVRQMASGPVAKREVWTPAFTEEVTRILQAGVQRKLDYVRADFWRRFGDDIESYGFKSAGCGTAVLLLGVCGGAIWML